MSRAPAWRAATGGFDETFESAGRPCAHYHAVLSILRSFSPPEIGRRERRDSLTVPPFSADRHAVNVYPAAVERVLQGIEGVAASALFGVPDERLGERVVAVVEKSDDGEVDVDAVARHWSRRPRRAYI